MARRRPSLAWFLFLAFVVVPIVEIYVIIQVGQVIGAWWTVVLLIADSLLGGWLVRHEGARAWQALRTALETGRMPSNELADAALILIGGTLMLSPGFVLDVLGVLLILPFTRPLFRRLLARVVSRRLAVVDAFGGVSGMPPGMPGFGRDAAGNATRPGRGSQGPVVQGEVVDD